MGWLTAANPEVGLLFGYLWSTEDYPWISHWVHLENGEILYRGLEFGTTGLHQPFPVLVEKGEIFDHHLFRYIDAGESQSYTYTAFQMRIPPDYAGTEKVSHENGILTAHEGGGQRRTFSLLVDK